MPNLTLSIPEKLKHEMEQLPETNWSVLVRKFLAERTKRLLVLKKLDESLKDSKLTEEDCIRLGRELKERVWKKHKEEGW